MPISHVNTLDSARGVAVLLVLMFHCPVPAFQLPFGWAGVNLFFILSGFLITRILLDLKPAEFKEYLRIFYLRRVIRIYPLYLAYLFLCILIILTLSVFFTDSNSDILLALNDLRSNWPFLVTFTYNFSEIYNFLGGLDYSNSYFFGHLWTLSVEHQFYLFFPILVFFLSRKKLVALLIILVVLDPLVRLAAVIYLQRHVNDLNWIGDILYISTPFQFDTISLGALLALIDLRQWSARILPFAVSATLVLVTIGIIHIIVSNDFSYKLSLRSLGYDIPPYHPVTLSESEIFNHRYFYSIPMLNFAFAGWLGYLIYIRPEDRFHKTSLLQKTGQWSYSIYLFHLPVSLLIRTLFENYIETAGTSLPVQTVVFLAYLLLLRFIAGSTNHLIEKRFSRLKTGLRLPMKFQ